MSRPSPTSGKPAHEGLDAIALSFLRSCHRTNKAKRGTKIPCSKLGSREGPTHCRKSRARIEAYSQPIRSNNATACQPGKPGDERCSFVDRSRPTSTGLPIGRALASENMRKRLCAQSKSSPNSAALPGDEHKQLPHRTRPGNQTGRCRGLKNGKLFPIPSHTPPGDFITLDQRIGACLQRVRTLSPGQVESNPRQITKDVGNVFPISPQCANV